MPVSLDAAAHPTRQLRRSVRDEIRRARQALEGRPPDVHDARRTLKRARALVRLGRAAWGPEPRRRLGHALREAGRGASRTRDAEAVVEAVDRLTTRPELACVDALELLRDRLVWRRDAGNRADAAPSMAASLSALRHVARQLKRHPPRGRDRGMAIFHPGLLRITERGAAALEAARRRPDDPDAHHRLRKRAKDLRHALEFLEPVWPAVIGAWTAELHRLTDRLGDANDLTVVLRRLEADPDLGAGLDLPGLAADIRDVRAARWAAGLDLAGRIWGVPPEDFARSVDAWARAWTGPDP